MSLSFCQQFAVAASSVPYLFDFVRSWHRGICRDYLKYRVKLLAPGRPSKNGCHFAGAKGDTVRPLRSAFSSSTRWRNTRPEEIAVLSLLFPALSSGMSEGRD